MDVSRCYFSVIFLGEGCFLEGGSIWEGEVLLIGLIVLFLVGRGSVVFFIRVVLREYGFFR